MCDRVKPYGTSSAPLASAPFDVVTHCKEMLSVTPRPSGLVRARSDVPLQRFLFVPRETARVVSPAWRCGAALKHGVNKTS